MTQEPVVEQVLLAKAIAIASTAHQHQFNPKNGEPYILHPLRVMQRATLPELKIIAVLHDLLEDCPEWTANTLRSEGFSEEIVVAIECLTKRPGEPYTDFIDRVCTNRWAMYVKLHDLHDNLDPSRLAQLDEATADRLRNKYVPAQSRILHALGY